VAAVWFDCSCHRHARAGCGAAKRPCDSGPGKGSCQRRRRGTVARCRSSPRTRFAKVVTLRNFKHYETTPTPYGSSKLHATSTSTCFPRGIVSRQKSWSFYISYRGFYAATRPPRVLSVAQGPHHKPFESARTARGLRARNRVGAFHALRRAERRGAREKGGDQDQRTIRTRLAPPACVQSRQRGLEWIPGILKGS